MAAHIDHIGCLVPDIDEALADYQVLHPEGLVSELFHVPAQSVNVRFFSFSNVRIEFVQPLDESSSLFRMLKKTPGLYHIGVFTNDIDAEIARLESNGYRPINKFSSPAFDGRYCAFLFNRQMQLVELIETADK